MPFKTPVIVFGSIVVLTALMLLLLEPPNSRDTQEDTQHADTAAENGDTAAVERGDAERIKSDIQRLIGQAADNDDFINIANKIAEDVSAAESQNLLETLFARWVQLNVVNALDSARSFSDRNGIAAILENAIVAGGRIDFAAVYNWIGAQKNMPDGYQKALVNILYYGIGRDSQILALAFIDLLPDDAQKEQILRALVEQWASQDMQAALSWLDSREQSGPVVALKNSLLARSTQQAAETPDKAIREMQAGMEKNKLAREYAGRLARTDIAEATAWARSLDDPEAYKIALSAVFEAWVIQEPDKKIILEELLAESDSAVRDHLINEVALDIASTSPQDLAAMINQVPETAQTQVAEKVVRFWQARSHEDTLSWINGLGKGPVKDRAVSVMTEYLLDGNRSEQAIALIGEIEEKSVRYESSKKLIDRVRHKDSAEAAKLLDDMKFLSPEEKESILPSGQ
jgi:hypothetical protein